jgi:hypothetical protein
MAVKLTLNFKFPALGLEAPRRRFRFRSAAPEPA